MNHRTSARFWRCYRELQKDIRDLAHRNYANLKADPSHGSLHFTKIGDLWSARVGLHYRVLVAESGDDLFGSGRLPPVDGVVLNVST